VVSDGSSDRTAEIASSFQPEITLIAYEQNRGYGAALKQGFQSAKGDLLAFLDADGTCDPSYFIPMVNTLLKEAADISIGSRMTPESSMPRTRRIGNKIFRSIINLLGDADITDCASGMRIIRRESLSKIYPLPDGLHFTPAMTCRAVLDTGLKIVEIPMKYKERVGRSKLGVVKDGFRFLWIIVDIGLTYRPLRLLGTIGLLFELMAFALGLSIVRVYFATGMIAEDIIYRFVVLLTLGVSGFGLLTLGTIAEMIVQIESEKRRQHSWIGITLLSLFYRPWPALVGGILMLLISALVTLPSVVEYLRSGFISWHWSYIVTGSFCFLMGCQLLSHATLVHLVRRLRELTEHRERLPNKTG
jgi:glycosyltransferase involved in cell wall biosynthesis